MEQSTCSAVIDELGLRPEEDSEEDHNKEKKKFTFTSLSDVTVIGLKD